MAYVYRYIDLDKEEVIYVGKVTNDENKETGYNPLLNRYKQHFADAWYKENKGHIAMQYIKDLSPVDADILESWLIAYYDPEQLYNKSKKGWGNSRLDLMDEIKRKWEVFEIEYQNHFSIDKYSMIEIVLEKIFFPKTKRIENTESYIQIINKYIREHVEQRTIEERIKNFNWFKNYKRGENT